VAGHLAEHPNKKVLASFPRSRRSTPRDPRRAGRFPRRIWRAPRPSPPSADWCRLPAPPANIARQLPVGI